MGAILGRCISPAQAVAIDEDNAAEDTPIVDARHAMALRKIRPEPLHLSLAKPIQITHQALLGSRTVNHAGLAASTRLMGPDPNPFVWVPAAILGVGGGGFEAVCAFLVDERITEYEEVLTIMESFAAHADPKYFQIVKNAIPAFINLSDGEGSWIRYDIEDLYIADGMLKSRDWGPNTKIGRIVLLSDNEVFQSDSKKD
ncbi:hypothetical protein P775_25365 [Puniceibacterium antarcticum]|uniref:Uncharacterized protein n=2 Tax=Puniceibacterium antarcticum TaxID=1206336 RepID=A0A2G8R432_9RHOB|nr:hypothetical protein P775_25365 [Puniceibacterium antarcticum]